MPDRYAGQTAGSSAPAIAGFTITPNDSTDLAELTRGIFVGSGGTLVVQIGGGASLTFQGVPSGSILPVRASRILATGTTASALVALV